MQFGLWAWCVSRNHEKMGVPIPPPREGAIFGKGSPIVKYRHFLPWAVQKRLNRLVSLLGCGLGCAEGITTSIVFARWRQCDLPCEHIGATWQIWLNRLSAAAMQSYVKLLWPLVLHYNRLLQYFRVLSWAPRGHLARKMSLHRS